MFADFNKTFKESELTNIEIPDVLLKHLNKELPDGTIYAVDNGVIYITSNGKAPISFGGLEFNPTEDQKKVLGDNPSYDKILRYLYNSQKEMSLKTKEDGYITLNGKKFEVDKISCNPMIPIKHELKCNMLTITPQPFPKPFYLEVGCQEFSMQLKINRIPNESVNIAKYQSDTDKPLSIAYSIDNSNNSMKSFDLSFDLSKAATIKDIVETITIFNAFALGNGRLGGIMLPDDFDYNAVKYDENLLLFWKRVLEIEKILNKQFIPPKDIIEHDERCAAETLYQNLVNKVPIKLSQVITSFNSDLGKSSEEDVKNAIGKPIPMQFISKDIYSLFGLEFELPCIVSIFNSKILKYEKNKDKFKIYIEDESEDKKIYISSLCFKSEFDLKKYMEKISDQNISAFQNAKGIQSYLNR